MSTTDDQQVRPGLLIGLGVIVGLAALYALWTFVISPLLTGADDPAPTPAPVTQQPDDAATEPDVAGEDGVDGDPGQVIEEDPFAGLGSDPVPETFEIFTARDPFQQLVVEVDAVDGDGTAGAVVDPDETTVIVPLVPADLEDDGGGDAPDAPDGAATGSGTDAPDDGSDDITTQSAPASTRPAAAPAGDRPAVEAESESESDDAPAETGTHVLLRDVFSGSDGIPTLIVAVDDITYEVREGDVFADRFQVLSIAETCVDFLFGDSRFALCEGESLRR